MIDIAEEMYGVDIKKTFDNTVRHIWQNREKFGFSMNETLSYKERHL